MDNQNQKMDIDPVFKMEQDRIRQQRSKDDLLAESDSNIQEFFANKTIFITGGTGFLGKHLVEKLLRSCSKINKIYLLFRAKKGKNSDVRFKELFENQVFQEVKLRYPDCINKVHYMEGDVEKDNFGMSEEDRTIFSDEVQIIFHGAATIRFDEPLKKAVIVNVKGTREMFKLAATCKNLVSMVHVSTAFSHYPLRTVKEVLYPMTIHYESVIDFAEKLDENNMNVISPTLLGDWGVNTYAFTKAMCEDIVNEYADKLPVSIFRPAMVLPAYVEPMPGWVEPSCMYSATGILLGAGLGAIKVILADENVSADVVPVDFVTNTAISVAWKTAKDYKKVEFHVDPKIYTLKSANTNTLTWGKIRELLQNDCMWMASPKIFWHGWSYFITNVNLFLLLAFIFHTIPAVIVDFICLLIGKKFNARKLDATLTRLLLIIKPFTLSNFYFDDSNCKELFKELSDTDKLIFPFDIKKINWSDYIQVSCLGLRRYVVKDGLQGTKVGLKKVYWFRIAYYLFNIVKLIILYVIFKKFFAFIFSMF